MFFHLSLHQTIMSLADGKLIQTQTWEGKTTIIEREIQDCRMIAVCAHSICNLYKQMLSLPIYIKIDFEYYIILLENHLIRLFSVASIV